VGRWRGVGGALERRAVDVHAAYVHVRRVAATTAVEESGVRCGVLGGWGVCVLDDGGDATP
jgi:hypothetical protein